MGKGVEITEYAGQKKEKKTDKEIEPIIKRVKAENKEEGSSSKVETNQEWKPRKPPLL